jgi:hypothetical protein
MRSRYAILFSTIAHLRPVQLWYRARNSIVRRLQGRKDRPIQYDSIQVAKPLDAIPFLPSNASYKDGTFDFLNRQIRMDPVNWDFQDFGRLWTYNLNYFDFLMQEEMDPKTGLALMHDFARRATYGSTGMEPYPLSLRSMNWIKFLSLHNIHDEKLNGFLFAGLQHLGKNPEYHLLGNHLLENGFTLLSGAAYFKDEKLSRVARKILFRELEEQIFPDGAHFERSPMYHMILLSRLLDAVNILQNNPETDKDLLTLCREKASRMTTWLRFISFRNGMIPLFNDAANNIAPPVSQLLEYARKLAIQETSVTADRSGFRKFFFGDFEVAVDAGTISPAYQPGHAHAGIFSFEICSKGRPFIVDTGTSTYESSKRRETERSTASHNTITVNGEDQAEMWARHRVGRRPDVKILQDTPEELSAEHNGYRQYGVLHRRKFRISGVSLEIQDFLDGSSKQEGVFHLHFYPGIDLKLDSGNTIVTSLGRIRFTGSDSVEISDYEYAPEFNRRIAARSVKIKFKTSLTTLIEP